MNSETSNAHLSRRGTLNRAANYIGEVKNVKTLRFTRQLQDFAAFAQKYEYRFEIVIRKGNGTVLTPKMEAAVVKYHIILSRTLE